MQEVQTRFVEPSAVATHFHFRSGDRIADFGAGSGYFLKTLSNAVGPDGKVYACDVQKNHVEKLGNLAEEEHLGNVETLWCDLETSGGIKLADDLLDGAVLINTLFQLEDKKVALPEMARTLRKGAKFIVIDWTESFAGLGPSPDMVVGEENVKELATAAGLQYERDFPAGAHHYGLAFRKT